MTTRTDRKARRAVKNSQNGKKVPHQRFERHFNFNICISPAVRDVVGDDNLEGLRPVWNAALKSFEDIDWA